MIKEQMLVNLPPEAIEDSDTFRTKCLYTEACDNVFQASEKAHQQHRFSHKSKRELYEATGLRLLRLSRGNCS